jgi:1,4-dihydroxy-2-naphthoate octaprenyltransferase
MQIGANFANDLFDHERGTDTPDRLGPIRMTASGVLSPSQMRLGTGLIFALAAFIGIYLIWLRGWPVIVLGLAIIIAALAYTGGPFPYGYHAMGDVFVFLSFGVAAVCGTYYALSGVVTPAIFWASVPMGVLIINILVVNNTRDIATDTIARKRTLAVIFGKKAMFIEYLVCLVIAYLVPPLLWLSGMAPVTGLLACLSMPKAFAVYLEFTHAEGRALNMTLAATAQLALVYALLFAFGVAFF